MSAPRTLRDEICTQSSSALPDDFSWHLDNREEGKVVTKVIGNYSGD